MSLHMSVRMWDHVPAHVPIQTSHALAKGPPSVISAGPVIRGFFFVVHGLFPVVHAPARCALTHVHVHVHVHMYMLKRVSIQGVGTLDMSL